MFRATNKFVICWWKFCYIVNENWGFLLVKGWWLDGKLDKAKILEDGKRKKKGIFLERRKK